MTLPTEMQAIVCQRYGPPEKLKYERVPVPQPKNDQVLIRVVAVGINALDWRICRGDPFLLRCMFGLFGPRKYTIPGADVAGIIVSKGKGVDEKWNVGQEIVGDASGGKLFGGLAEYAVLNAAFIAAKPPELSFEQVAAMPVAANTALQAFLRFGVQPKDKVLINGASGGVGSFAVQIAKAMDAHVTGVCSASKMAFVRECGADVVLDYNQVDYTAQDVQYDTIVDIVAHHDWKDIQKVLSPKGHFVVVGGPLKKLMVFGLQRDPRITVLNSEPSAKELETILKWMQEGKVQSKIDCTYTLAQGSQAVGFVDAGNVRGKVVVTVPPAS